MFAKISGGGAIARFARSWLRALPNSIRFETPRELCFCYVRKVAKSMSPCFFRCRRNFTSGQTPSTKFLQKIFQRLKLRRPLPTDRTTKILQTELFCE